MGVWRYVVSVENRGDHDELVWEIRELYPTGEGRFGFTADSVKPGGASYEELVRDLDHMRQDSRLKILDLRDDEPRLVAVNEVQGELSSEPSLGSFGAGWKVPDVLCEPVNGQPRIVCICGSTRFRDEMADANRWLTLAGAIVVAPAVFQHRGDVITDEQKEGLDALHLRKIDLADAVFVVDPGGYIGESTSREIAYAESHSKPVARLSSLAEPARDGALAVGGLEVVTPRRWRL